MVGYKVVVKIPEIKKYEEKKLKINKNINIILTIESSTHIAHAQLFSIW